MGEMTAVFGAPEWRARSGRKVELHEDGTVTFEGVHGYLAPGAAMDAEELFHAKRDAELGRWRDPVMPDRVVSPIGDGAIHVYNEVSRAYSVFERPSFGGHAVRTSVGDFGLTDTADRFFDAHPGPKPWHSASKDDFWLVTHMGVSETCRVDYVNGVLRFVGVESWGTSVSMPVTHPSITDAVRLVLEVTS